MPQVFKIGTYLVFLWFAEGVPLEPIHVHVCEGVPNQNATKIWILSNDSFRLANNNSQVPPKIMRHLLAVMQASLEEYKALWLQYQKDIKYIDG